MTGVPSSETGEFRFSSDMTLEDVRSLLAQGGDWQGRQTPRNVLLDLVGEVGGMADLLKWKGEVACGLPELSHTEKLNITEGLSNALLSLINLASRCHIDLPLALHNTLQSRGAVGQAQYVPGNSVRIPPTSNYVSNAYTGGSASYQHVFEGSRDLVGAEGREREREEGDGSE